MFKSIETLFAVYASFLQAAGTMLMSFAKVSAAAIPVVRNTLQVIEQEKYAHLKTRCNKIRDIAMQLVTEVLILKAEVVTAVEENKGDFKDFRDFGTMVELEFKNFGSLGADVVNKVMAHASAYTGSVTAFKAWVAASSEYSKLDDAINGPVVTLSYSQYVEVIEGLYYKEQAAQDSSDFMSNGVTIDELSKCMALAKDDYLERFTVHVNADIMANGVSHVKVNGIRYTVN